MMIDDDWCCGGGYGVEKVFQGKMEIDMKMTMMMIAMLMIQEDDMMLMKMSL